MKTQPLLHLAVLARSRALQLHLRLQCVLLRVHGFWGPRARLSKRLQSMLALLLAMVRCFALRMVLRLAMLLAIWIWA